MQPLTIAAVGQHCEGKFNGGLVGRWLPSIAAPASRRYCRLLIHSSDPVVASCCVAKVQSKIRSKFLRGMYVTFLFRFVCCFCESWSCASLCFCVSCVSALRMWCIF